MPSDTWNRQKYWYVPGGRSMLTDWVCPGLFVRSMVCPVTVNVCWVEPTLVTMMAAPCVTVKSDGVKLKPPAPCRSCDPESAWNVTPPGLWDGVGVVPPPPYPPP